MKTSSYEEKIIKILQKDKIKFEREKRYPDLNHGYYRFDFFIPDKNILIEMEGIQHYKFIKAFYKKRVDFTRAQERDRKKNSYCLARDIPLYRIPYFELDNIHSFDDIIQDKFRVKTKWHNDQIKIPKT